MYFWLWVKPLAPLYLPNLEKGILGLDMDMDPDPDPNPNSLKCVFGKEIFLFTGLGLGLDPIHRLRV